MLKAQEPNSRYPRLTAIAKGARVYRFPQQTPFLHIPGRWKFLRDRENALESPALGAMSAKCAAMCPFEGTPAQTANWMDINVLFEQLRIRGELMLFLTLPSYWKAILLREYYKD